MASHSELRENDRRTLSEHPRAAADARLPSLTGLRFAAALLVFGFHIQAMHVFPAHSAGQTAAGRVFGHGAIGVSFFFILSGFVLTWSTKPNDSARRIWRKRAAKIYPSHLVTAIVALLGALALSSSVSGGRPGLSAIVPNLLLVQAWDPNPSVYFGLNTVSWSLSCEALFYFSFPFLLKLLDRVSERTLWPLAAGMATIVWCLPLATSGWSSATAYWFIYVFPPSRVAEFCLGMLMARIVRTERWARVPAWAAGAALAAAYATLGYLPARFGYVAATVIPLALLVPALATADLRGDRTLWARRVMVRLGELSFAFYLVHQLVIRYAMKLLPTALGAPDRWSTAVCLLATAAIAAASLLAAWLLNRTVEDPLNQRLRPHSTPAPRLSRTPTTETSHNDVPSRAGLASRRRRYADLDSRPVR